MPDSKPSPNMTLAAFKEPLHLVLLFLGAFLMLADIGVEGLAPVAFLEVLYLLIVPRLVPYKRRVRLKTASKQWVDRAAQREQKAASLTRDVRRRYQSLAYLYEGLMKREEALPINKPELEDLMDAALTLALLLQDNAQIEEKSPLEALRNEAASAEADSPIMRTLEAREKGAQQNTDLIKKLEEVEALLQNMHTQSTTQVGETVDTKTITADVDVALRTAREMAAFSLKQRSL